METHYNAARQHQVWSPAQDTRLRKMIKDGKNSEEIATELGRTRAAVMNRKQVLGIKQKMAPARGSKMPYTAYDKKRTTNTGVKNAPLMEEAKPEPVDVKAEVKAIVHETKSVLKDTGKKFKSIGNSIDMLFRKAKKQGLKVTITIDSEIE